MTNLSAAASELRLPSMPLETRAVAGRVIEAAFQSWLREKIKALRPERLRDLMSWTGNGVSKLTEDEHAERDQLIRAHVAELSQKYDIPQKTQSVTTSHGLIVDLQSMESNLAVILSSSWRRRQEDGLTMLVFLKEAGVRLGGSTSET